MGLSQTVSTDSQFFSTCTHCACSHDEPGSFDNRSNTLVVLPSGKKCPLPRRL